MKRMRRAVSFVLLNNEINLTDITISQLHYISSTAFSYEVLVKFR